MKTLKQLAPNSSSKLLFYLSFLLPFLLPFLFPFLLPFLLPYHVLFQLVLISITRKIVRFATSRLNLIVFNLFIIFVGGLWGLEGAHSRITALVKKLFKRPFGLQVL